MTATATGGKNFPVLTSTGDMLRDSINWIEEKNIVVLHTTTACKVFHAIPLDPPEFEPSLEAVRVIYVNCNKLPDLLSEGNWEYCIKEAIQNVIELDVESKLRETIIDQKQTSVPNRVYLSLNM